MFEVNQALEEILDEFEDIEDRMEKFEFLHDLASEVNELPTEQWDESTRIHGCQSEAHVKCWIEDDIVHFRGGADASIVAGLMGIISIAVHQQPISFVRTLEPEFLERTGLLNSLTPSRSNGFRNIFTRVKQSIGE